MSITSKQAQAFEHWLQCLTPAAQADLRRTGSPARCPPDEDEEAGAYAAFRSCLSPQASEQLDQLAGAEQPPDDTRNAQQPCFCLVEGRDGQWPVLRTFKSAEGLARRIGQLEGEDVILWPFFGVPLEFSKGGQRYLRLPDGENLLSIPRFEGGPVSRLPVTAIRKFDAQDTGFVGPPELASNRAAEEKLQAALLAEERDDDEEDEDDEN